MAPDDTSATVVTSRGGSKVDTVRRNARPFGTRFFDPWFTLGHECTKAAEPRPSNQSLRRSRPSALPRDAQVFEALCCRMVVRVMLCGLRCVKILKMAGSDAQWILQAGTVWGPSFGLYLEQRTLRIDKESVRLGQSDDSDDTRFAFLWPCPQELWLHFSCFLTVPESTVNTAEPVSSCILIG